MENDVWLILIALIAFLVGSLPSSYLVTRKLSGKDIRSEGTGNIGAMNAFRAIETEKSAKLGAIGFALVLIADTGKGALAIFAARWLALLGYDLGFALIIGSFFVVLGHNYSIFFKFKRGGRGIACLLGILLALDWPLFFVWGGVILVSTFLAQNLLVGKIDWSKFPQVFSVLGTQIVGRVGGIIIALVPLYFLNSQFFLPITAATFLLVIKHIARVKNYIGELKVPSQKVG